MKLPRSASKGFTLVELMIVVGILAVVSGIMIPSFSGYTRNQTLKQAQENLKSDLRSAQNRALTGTGADTLINGNPALYWAVLYSDVAGSNGTYSFYLTASNSCTVNATLQQTVTLSSGISIVSSGAHCLLFSLEDGSVFERNATTGLTVPIPDTTISLRHSSDTATVKNILINKAGLIFNSN
ncbi:MAG: hypothetical protein ACD_25C00092G0002 [uncultured bacterium]|uniref:Prepilin-type N-terminal cleavage/methylation domain-containing protein n=1 Tax=candidate division WWE3 bacterium TaxID=2053526 RepID=A0A656PPP1_UNCKA|nr:hypothetical protein P147_WWE3C00001G0461 [candidate division WWE3 bacterium RAAC2_WWE3_1]EKD95041.1 MAG: hypothetical protein ACD_25C00092G0002 [uncultured bacterium]OGC68223.1 MAG: hypothetical protein A2364_01040 [candidate division WWE3 bacterium RIFOXYB1_FULL_43_12]HAI95045.1 prepilin-type cleavage/methylation domain-containing protein [candidate division WWE3 bacterium]HBL00850.1 prepilin-type cleavage/methylation domain-containing protein [candidate division WWE3 bacterium]